MDKGKSTSMDDKNTLRVSADEDNLDRILAFVDDHLKAVKCPGCIQRQIDIAVEELFVNIAHYAYASGHGDAEISVTIGNDPREAFIELRDRGIPFDPLERTDPDVTLPAEKRKIGGLGIYMVKQSMDHVFYRRENGENILTIRRLLHL